MTGYVIWFDLRKGYGFIQAPAGRFFVHKTQVLEREGLTTGAHVEFDVQETPMGRRAGRAVGVRRVGASATR